MRILFSFLILNVIFFSNCQIVNIENKRIYDDSVGWSGNLDASFSYIDNKDYFYNFKSNARIQYKTRKHYFLFLSDFFYSGGKIVYGNAGLIHFRYAYRIKNSAWKWETYLQSQYNQLLNQKNRSLIGSGIRAKLFDKENMKLFFGTSIFYEYEEIQPNREFNNDYRWSNYLSWFIPYKKINFTGTTYFQPLLSNFNDFRLSGQYAFNSNISKNFRIKLEYFIYYDSKPPTGVKTYISSFLVGFGIDFGK
jgi:hypothetical protein